ncbi:LacI family transcriptional regulator [Leucobacter allii]|uniref:LacI family DNA-binding transcriptional regulator n=1 Tax=Leucobacter allii TaxID=2932247 RepID=UPI001FD57738|nr:LacI family DNA-binding transcriptional regulator [Leucobacter allii]UOR01326.1 LacI family transcriptional regulator [Leucobacter allii]
MVTGARTVTLREVAASAGVHVATASRALNPEQAHLVSERTRTRVQTAARSLGYRTNALARSLRQGRTGSLGVIVADLANPFIANLLRGVEEEARAHAAMPLIVETREDPAALRRAVQRLLGNRVDAIVLASAHLADADYVADVSAQLPLVLALRGFDVGEDGPEPAAVEMQVMQDDHRGAKVAVEHLLRLGHRRIAQLAGAEQISSFVNRRRGFADAMATAPGARDVSSEERANESSVSEGKRLTWRLLERPEEERPTAIFAHNDLMAIGALDAIRDAGLVCPADVSVVGYNDSPLVDHLSPPLTTVRLPSREMGRSAARLALAAAAGRPIAAPRILLEPTYIERRSTGPAPA